MTIRCTPKNLLREANAGKEFSKEHLGENWYEQIRAYHGPFFSTYGRQTFYPENLAYQYASLVLPRIIYNNPGWIVRSARGPGQQQRARIHQHGLNRWTKQTNLSRCLMRIGLDFLFRFGVGLISSRGDGRESEDDQRWPQLYHLEPDRFLLDPKSRRFEECKWIGHRQIYGQQDLLDRAKENKDEGWDVDAIRGITPGNVERDLQRDRRQYDVMREEVEVIEMVVPDKELKESPGEEEGFSGTIYTVCDDLTEEYIRKPRPYFGKRWGPYIMFGAYDVPGSPYAMGPITASEGNIRNANAQALAMANAIRHYKRCTVLGGPDQKVVELLNNAPDMFLAFAPGHENAKATNFEIGGPSTVMFEAMAYTRNLLDRDMGMSDVQRGNVGVSNSATEASIAAEASMGRMGYLRERFAQGVVRAGDSISHIFHYDDDLDIGLGEEAGEEFGMASPRMRGGHMPGESVDDLELDIEPHSMERKSEQTMAKRAEAEIFWAINVTPIMQQFNFMDWPAIARDYGDAHGIPDFDRRVLVPEMIEAQDRAAQQQMQQEAPKETAFDSTKKKLTSTAPAPSAPPTWISKASPSGAKTPKPEKVGA